MLLGVERSASSSKCGERVPRCACVPSNRQESFKQMHTKRHCRCSSLCVYGAAYLPYLCRDHERVFQHQVYQLRLVEQPCTHLDEKPHRQLQLHSGHWARLAAPEPMPASVVSVACTYRGFSMTGYSITQVYSFTTACCTSLTCNDCGMHSSTKQRTASTRLARSSKLDNKGALTSSFSLGEHPDLVVVRSVDGFISFGLLQEMTET